MIRGHDRISIGDNVVIHPGAIFSVVAEHDGVTYEPRLSIGNNVRIGCDMVVACCGRIDIGDDVLAADRVFIGDTFHAYRDPTEPILSQGLADPRPVSIGRGAFLGVNSAILPGVTVGEGAFVGASAVVNRDIPPRSLVVGNPARVVRRWDGEAWVDCDPPN
jgi:acetyltransferase-like isoleucine patch superfamily enzyme